MATAKDQDAFAFAVSTGRLLLTADKDFGELVFRDGPAHAGIVLIRLSGLAMMDRAAIVSDLFRERADEIVGAFTVVDTNSVRIR
jgi:predicted nuclease of predicted toxin-antitoxin system